MQANMNSHNYAANLYLILSSNLIYIDNDNFLITTSVCTDTFLTYLKI
jgi:hypothetical protein